MKRSQTQIENQKRIIAELKESLDAGTCRGLVDAFLTHKKNLEVRRFHSTVTAGSQRDTFKRQKPRASSLLSCVQDADANNLYYHHDNLLHTTMNLFAAGTDTTADTLTWGLLFITKYPHIQGA